MATVIADIDSYVDYLSRRELQAKLKELKLMLRDRYANYLHQARNPQKTEVGRSLLLKSEEGLRMIVILVQVQSNSHIVSTLPTTLSDRREDLR